MERQILSLIRRELVPQSSSALAAVPAPTTWATVVGRKARRKGKKVFSLGEKRRPPAVSVDANQRSGGEEKAKLGRLFSGAAVFLTVGEGSSYAEVTRKAAAAVDLKKVGISGLRIKKATTIGMLLQIPGPGEAEKTNVERASKVFEGAKGVKFTRPVVKHAEVRVRNVVLPLFAEDIASCYVLGETGFDRFGMPYGRRAF